MSAGNFGGYTESIQSSERLLQLVGGISSSIIVIQSNDKRRKRGALLHGIHKRIITGRAEGDGVTADFTDSEGIKDAFYHEDGSIGLAEDV